MSWDGVQREVLAELGLQLLAPRAPGSEAPPPDPHSLAMLSRGLGIAPEHLAEAGLRLPPIERLREPAIKRALWPQLRPLRRRS
ncbi:hypothetical protein [Luteimonas sp. e5]